MSFPAFVSVYDWVEGFGRTKSVSYRMWRGAKRGSVWTKVEAKSERKAFKRAVKKAKEMRNA